MDFLRTLVSQQKNRYEEDGFNLDLTYITPRTIAMAFPADGLESLFRNRIDDVARLLDLKHKNKYIVFNASNRLYDESKFFNRVRSMNWPNHYPCPLEHFISMVLESLEFLTQDPNNAVIVHCLAGKGRTGSFLNALHYATGQFPSIEAANQFYKLKRAVNVTYASQLRYLDYFVHFFEQGADQFDYANKAIERVQLRSTNREFMTNLNHVVRFFDFSRGDFQLAEGTFGATIHKEENPENPDLPVLVADCQLSPWRDSNSTDILVNLRVSGLLASKLLRANFSMLSVKTPQLVFQPCDVDKPKGLPKDFKMIFFINKFALGKEGQARQESMRALQEKAAQLKAKVEVVNLRETMFGDQAVRKEGNK